MYMSDLPFLQSGGQEFTLTLPFYAGAKVIIINMYSDMEYKFQRFVKAIEKYKVQISEHFNRDIISLFLFFICFNLKRWKSLTVFAYIATN